MVLYVGWNKRLDALPCSAPLGLELVMILGMYTEQPSVGMLSQFQQIGMCIEQ